MSNLIPEMTLYVNSSEMPYYTIDVALPSDSGYEISSHGEILDNGEPHNQVHVDVYLSVDNGGSEAIQIDLGALSIDPNDGEIHIKLLDAELQSKGGGIVKTEEATEDSK